jgi:cytochrome P450
MVMHSSSIVTGDGQLRPQIPADLAADLTNPLVHGSDRIHQIFSWLRANQPLGIAVTEKFEPFWVVTRQQELRTMAKMPEVFNNGDRIVLVDRKSEERMAEMFSGRKFPIRTILQMDPPEHGKYRDLTAEYFHARSIDTLSDQIRSIARKFIGRLLETGGECDFTSTVAFRYPLHVIMSLLGVPEKDEPEMLRLTQEFFGAADADFERQESATSAGDALAAVCSEFNAFFDALLADRRVNPGEDLISILANSEVDGAPIGQFQARSYCAHLATAGHDTTSGTTSGGVLELCKNPDLFRQVKADRSLIPALVEEATRFCTPSRITMRTAAQDMQVCGRQFRTGDWIAMAWASGSRDEAVIDNPHEFRVDRRANKLISYGFGPHVCLGQHLARLEMRLLFDELFKAVDSIELAGEPTMMQSVMVTGLKTLPIRFTAS